MRGAALVVLLLAAGGCCPKPPPEIRYVPQRVEVLCSAEHKTSFALLAKKGGAA